MNVPFYTSTREYERHKKQFDEAIQAVLDKGDFILGSSVAEFEKEVAAYTGAKYAVGLANGSDALVIASDILEYKKDAEVLTPTFTFFASTSCIVRNGAKPVFCDVDEDTFCMDMNDAERRITKKTKGIIPVHLFLQTVDMEKCTEIAKQNNLTILEDAAEAFGMKTRYKGKQKHAGTIGDFGIFSFFPTKTLGAYGDGGMMVTDNEELYKKVKSYRVHGSSIKYHHDYIGYNSRIDTLQAAILRIKLQRIDESIALRAKHAAQYRELLQGIDQIKSPFVKTNSGEVYYVFSIKAENRDSLNQYLQANGIGTSIYYPIPLHLQKCFAYLGYKKGDFPAAEKLCTSVLALPMYPELREDEITYTCDCIKSFYKK